MYHVAFVCTPKAGPYAGIVTWFSWPSKAVFDQAWAEKSADEKAKRRILEEGITRARCLELVKQTPANCFLAVVMHEATREDGEVDYPGAMARLGEILHVLNHA